MPELFQHPNHMTHRGHEALRVAKDLFEQDPEWVIFFREVLGIDGVVSRLFKSQEELDDFRQSGEYAEIQKMVAHLRERTAAQTAEDKEPIRVITVRLPKSLHESLRAEAHERQTSMNKLCISKLLQVIDEEFVPQD
ncbi:toxin-antitoxin system HicB family antitoxin [Lignipirellula cremea]|uniref:HicB family protein n=1 Tax=Lignipirellula cremea TaxID=2528010 RepID=A0A518DXB9_9BACT|nr:toxin-antitoxin system HicB family antitoxin [Lignipirellula cremea]QDU96464.1 hypothetical protein Pla8534_42850 [Lignipirellula cremea]